MKKTLFVLLSVALMAACKTEPQKNTMSEMEARDTVASIPQTIIEFDSKTHEFGDIQQGEVPTHTYKFKNIGENDLIIAYVTPSCGCTVPKWTSAPVKPGEEGQIEVEFHTNGRRGLQRKSVSVIANTKPQMNVVSFEANVIVPEKK